MVLKEWAMVTENFLRSRSRRQYYTLLLVILLLGAMAYLATLHSFRAPMFGSFMAREGNATGRAATQIQRDYDVWPPFVVRLLNHDLFTQHCVPSGEFSISGIPDILAVWSKADGPHCRELYTKFTAIYTIEKRYGSVKIPNTFKAKVKAWLGNKDELFQELFHQDIIHVINMYTRETTVFNPLRDKRPVTKPKESEEDYLARITKESAVNCDFCKYKNYTAEHDFGRVESPLSFSASNIFKLDRLHAVITIRDHDPVNWSQEQYMDMMRLTNIWLEKAFSYDKTAVYPAIIWDLLPKSGSSQIHPHDQVFLSPNRYQGMVESWRRAAQDYFADFRSNYFTDLVSLYSALGLTVHHKSAVALASLTPKKDNEVVVIAPEADDDFFELIYFVLRAFMDDLKKYSFSLGGGYPAMSKNADAGKIPAFVRIITRGVMTEIRTDISALELFTGTNVNIDPYKVVKVIQESVVKRAPRM